MAPQMWRKSTAKNIMKDDASNDNDKNMRKDLALERQFGNSSNSTSCAELIRFSIMKGYDVNRLRNSCIG